MKLLKPILLGLCTSLFLVACEKAEPLTQYIITVQQPMTGNMPLSCLYANQTKDSLVFYSNCPWEITTYQGDDSWINIQGQKSGKANMFCRYGVTLSSNETGKARYAIFRITDSEQSDKAYTSFSFQQYASRIDGSLGNAPLVKSIQGSDGSEIRVAYDAMLRPLALSLKGNQTEHNLTMIYNDDERKIVVQEVSKFNYRDSTFFVQNAVEEGVYQQMNFNGVDNAFYDPYCLISLSTTSSANMRCDYNGTIQRSAVVDHLIEYRSFYMNDVFPVSFENAFKVLDQCGPFYTQYGIYYNGNGSLTIDDTHVADSMAIYRHYSDNRNVYETYKLSYSNVNNCATNLDVNQLLEGVDNCNPYLLLSMMRFARFTSVISEAKGRYNTYQVGTETNSNGSIRTMTVKDQNGKTITYTFIY